MDNPAQFYITLPSSACYSFFPQNTVTYYRTILDHEIDLQEEEYEVGLAEIHLRGNVFNYRKPVKMLEAKIPLLRENFENLRNFAKKISSGRLLYRIKEHESDYEMRIQDKEDGDYMMFLDIFLPPGSYTKYSDIIFRLSSTLSKATGMSFGIQKLKKITNLSLNTSDKTKFIFGHDIKQSDFVFTATKYFFFNFFKKSEDVIEFEFDSSNNQHELDSIIFKKGEMLSQLKKISDIKIPKPVNDEILIYSNICDFSYFGSTRAQILRVCNLQLEKHKFNTTRIYANPHYVKVYNNRIKNIEIELRDITGEYYNIAIGHIIIKLHFRKVNI